METTGNLFAKGLEKAFGTLPTMNTEIMLDALKYKDMVEGEVEEKWSEKYKKSIDCKNPKGFSQKAHCQGRKKKSENKEATGSGSVGGYSAPLFGEEKDTEKFEAPVAFADSEFVRKSHSETKKVEATEATSSSSSGQYSTPAFVAPNKKEWRGAAKPLYKGGAFVKVKKKCKNFPYCNQGDIKALKIYENESVKQAIKNVSEKYNVNENVIKSILQYELQNIKKSI
jgi:hypothetical protein